MITENVKGFKDYIGKEALKKESIKEIIVRNFKNYGFEPAETPIIEYEEFVKSGNEQDEAISDIYKLEDKGKRKLALRYEFTFQLRRLTKNKKLPYKRYQIGEVFRDEPISSNRFRQFIQCDADIIGSTIKEDAEILALSSSILKGLGIYAVINVNNRKLLNEVLDKEGIKNKEEVIKEIDKMDKLPEKEIRNNLKKYNADKLIQIFKKPKSFFKRYESYKEIEELEKYCNYYKTNINFSPSLARGLSYYTGTIFEIKTKEMRETVCAGGSYLVNNVQSTGISFGLERISELSKINPKEKRILIISIGEDKKAIWISKKLRKDNVDCIVMFGKVSKALEFANSYNIPYVVFVGKDEIKQKKVKLRDMATGKEKLVYLGEISAG